MTKQTKYVALMKCSDIDLSFIDKLYNLKKYVAKEAINPSLFFMVDDIRNVLGQSTVRVLECTTISYLIPCNFVIPAPTQTFLHF